MALATALWLLPGRASAAEATDANASARTIPELVLLIIDGAVEPPASLEARILSWFSADSSKLGAERRAELHAASVLRGPDAPGVRVWLLPRNATNVRLFFSVKDRAEGPARYLVTDFELERGFDELGLEQVSQVIYLSAKALWEGRLESSRSEIERELSATSPPAASTTPERPPAAPASRAAPARSTPATKHATLALRSGVSYGIRARGDEGVAHGPGTSFAVVSRRDAWQLGGRLRAQLLLPQTVERRQIELELRGYSVVVGAGFERRVHHQLWLGAELGAGADVIRFAASAEHDSGWRASPAEWELRPLLSASGGLSTELGLVRVGMTAQLALQLLETRYDVAEPSGSSVLLAPWLVQPGAALELSW